MPETDQQSETQFDEQRHLALATVTTSRDDLYEKYEIDRSLNDPDASADRYPPDWQARKAAVADYYDDECARCGRDLPNDWHCHHVQEISESGTHQLRNLVALCPECHALLHPFMDDIDWAGAPMFPASDADPRVAVERRPVSAPEDRWYAAQYLGGEELLGGAHNYQSRSGATTRVPAVAAVQKDNPDGAELDRLERRIAEETLVDQRPQGLPFTIGDSEAIEPDQDDAWWDKRRTVAAEYADELGVTPPWRDWVDDDDDDDETDSTAEVESAEADDGFDALVVKHEAVMGVGIVVGTFAVLFAAVLIGYLVDGLSERLAGVVAGVGLLAAAVILLFGTWVAAVSAAFGNDDWDRAHVGPWVLATVPTLLLVGYGSVDAASTAGVLAFASYSLWVRLGAVAGRDWARYVAPLVGHDSREKQGETVIAGVVLLAAIPGGIASLPLYGGPFEALLGPARALVGAYTPVLEAFAPVFSAVGIDYRAVSGYPAVGWPLALAAVWGSVSSVLYCVWAGYRGFR